MSINLPPKSATAKSKCELNHLFFTRYFFKHRQNLKFKVNWHHQYIADVIEEVLRGEVENVIFNVSPGSSKTEEVVINLIARGLAINPRSRFLHISYSDDLALLNSQTARDLVSSEEYQELWPLKISPDAKAKNRWNVLVDGKPAGGVYAVSMDGQITGFRAGHMDEGWQGCVIIDDPQKPDDAFSEVKTNRSNRKLLTTIKSRKANPKTPVIIIMQRIGEKDATGFLLSNKILKNCKHVVIPAIITQETLKTIPEKYHALMDRSVVDDEGNFSYWEYKEPIAELNKMRSGQGADKEGSRISRFVYASQYDQNPVAVGGNIIKGSWFPRYKVLPRIKYRKIYADTAQKTKERNDYSVFECWGCGDDGKIYLLDLLRGKWEAPDLKKNAVAFWAKHNAFNSLPNMGKLRDMLVEDKASGTGLIQELKLPPYNIPIKGIERNIDKLTRVMDGQTYIEIGSVCVPEDAPFTADFIAECEAFTADDSHSHDDQIDPCLDAIKDMLSSENKLKVWEQLGQRKT